MSHQDLKGKMVLNVAELADIISGALKKIARDVEAGVTEREDSFQLKGKAIASSDDLFFESAADAKREAIIQCEVIVKELSQEILRSLLDSPSEVHSPLRWKRHPISQGSDLQAWRESLDPYEELFDSKLEDEDTSFQNPLTGDIIHPPGPFTPGSSISANSKDFISALESQSKLNYSTSGASQSLTPASSTTSTKSNDPEPDSLVDLTNKNSDQLLDNHTKNSLLRLSSFPNYVLSLQRSTRKVDLGIEESQTLLAPPSADIPQEEGHLSELLGSQTHNSLVEDTSETRIDQTQAADSEKELTEVHAVTENRERTEQVTRHAEPLPTTKRGIMLELQSTRARILKLEAQCGQVVKATGGRPAERRLEPGRSRVTAGKAIFERNLDDARRLERERQQRENEAERRRADAERKATERIEAEKIKQQRIHEANERQRRARQVECVSCLEYFDKHRVSLAPCKHRYCHDCIRSEYQQAPLLSL